MRDKPDRRLTIITRDQVPDAPVAHSAPAPHSREAAHETQATHDPAADQPAAASDAASVSQVADSAPTPPADERPDGRRWRSSPLLCNAVLEPLHELNREYLLTLTRMPRNWHAATHARLPDPVCLTLMALDSQRRAEAARCPFSLFSARFHEPALWLSIANPAAVNETDTRNDDALAPLVSFTQAALFFAWHLAQSNASAARLVFGMPPRTIAVFAGLTLTRLQRIAREHCDVIAPRWPQHTSFWRMLLEVAAREPDQPVSQAHLLGMQMLAAEMCAAQDPRPINRRRRRP